MSFRGTLTTCFCHNVPQKTRQCAEQGKVGFILKTTEGIVLQIKHGAHQAVFGQTSQHIAKTLSEHRLLLLFVCWSDYFPWLVVSKANTDVSQHFSLHRCFKGMFLLHHGHLELDVWKHEKWNCKGNVLICCGNPFWLNFYCVVVLYKTALTFTVPQQVMWIDCDTEQKFRFLGVSCTQCSGKATPPGLLLPT